MPASPTSTVVSTPSGRANTITAPHTAASTHSNWTVVSNRAHSPAGRNAHADNGSIPRTSGPATANTATIAASVRNSTPLFSMNSRTRTCRIRS